MLHRNHNHDSRKDYYSSKTHQQSASQSAPVEEICNLRCLWKHLHTGEQVMYLPVHESVQPWHKAIWQEDKTSSSPTFEQKKGNSKNLTQLEILL
ncbi:hypothetical protein Tco_0594067 [Tanacetum coccineum]